MVLSVAGPFNRIAQLSKYEFANWALEHYLFLTGNITMSHVVAWLVQHGVVRDGQAIRHLESFACARRNLKEGLETPMPSNFKSGDRPRCEADMLSLALGQDFVHWREVAHAGLQPDVESTYPAHPGHPEAMDEDGTPET
jgi:hypothetical protein